MKSKKKKRVKEGKRIIKMKILKDNVVLKTKRVQLPKSMIMSCKQEKLATGSNPKAKFKLLR